MKKQNRSKGFTMAEVLLVVALIAVLSGVAFIAVWNHLRSLTQLEYDGIAKEIFVAAQNHLTMAESQGYLQASSKSDYGTADTVGRENVYYFTVNKGDSFGDAGNLVLKLMLPFAAVDETVRAGGSYLIQYQAEPALVMNVFYSAPNGRFGHVFDGDEYDDLLDLADNSEESKSDRRNYGGDVIGWYGGEEARNLPIGGPMKEPVVEVINRERLQVKVSNPNGSGELKLIIKGMTSKKEKEFVLIEKSGKRNYYTDADGFTVTLDDITAQNGHFADLFPGFYPGEDISIQALAFNNNILTNIAYSAEKTTNSLYADLETVESTDDSSSGTSTNSATIAYLRHLENLDGRVSSLSDKIPISAAQQITDLSWTSFEAEIKEKKPTMESVSIWYGDTETEDECFLPVIPPLGISYDGLLHRISDIKVDISGNAGIFGETTNGSITGLLVIDSEFKTTSGNAGALIGKMTGTTVQGCAAFATVSGSADTGGLIGFASGGKIEGSYSAGHTDNGAYPAADDNNKLCDVISTGASAGGLIGSAAGTTVSSCYSTCSVCSVNEKTAAGGFIGAGSETQSNTITNSYATGFVTGPKKGAFAGTSPGALTGNWYYEIINEQPSDDASGKDNSFTYLPAIGGTAGDTLPAAAEVAALDATASSYNSFCGDPKNWKPAEPEDTALKNWYQGKYNLKTISQLLGSGADYAFFDTHYGDWPAPEIFVINTGTSSGSSGNGNGETAGG